MPRPSNTKERQEQIVEGLLRVMAERGYERASVAAIARTAGLTPGLVHYHFGSKQKILLALVQQLAGRLRTRYVRRLESSSPAPRARLHAYLDAHLALGEDADPAAVSCWVAIGAEALRQPEVGKIYQQVIREEMELLKELLSGALAVEGRSTERLDWLAAALMAAIQGAYQLATAAPGVTPPGFAAPTLKQMADGLIAAEGLVRSAGQLDASPKDGSEVTATDQGE